MVDLKTIIFYVIRYVMIAVCGTVMLMRTLLSMIRNRSEFFKSKKREFPPKVLVDGWNHGRVMLKDVSLHYVSAGDDGKPLILMVHGFPEFWYSWRHQLKEFEKDFKVVAIDLRGYGESDKPQDKDAYKMEKLTGDIAQIIPALGYKSCILLVHDWGGVIGWRFAAKYPKLVNKMIVCNCPHSGAFTEALQTDYKQRLKSWYIFAFQLPYLPEFWIKSHDFEVMEELLRKPPIGCRNGSNAITDDDLEAWKYTFSQPLALTSPINYYRENFGARNGPQKQEGSQKIQPPVLIIWGTADGALTQKSAEKSLEYCENGTLQFIEGASHWVQQDEPTLVNQYISEFVYD